MAGHGKGARAVDLVVPYLKECGNSVNYSITRYAGHATELAKSAVNQGYDLVVAVGGDGTVNEVAEALIGSNTALGIVPMGSGNGFARELGISGAIKKNRSILSNGENLRVDVCSFNGKRFFCTAGIGFDAIIAQQMSQAKTRGFLGYLRLALYEGLFFRPITVRMTVDGQEIQRRVFVITFANASQYGSNALIAPEASMTDEMFDVVVVNHFPKLLVPLLAVALFAGKINKLPFVETFRAKKVTILEADTPFFHFDGEPGKLMLPASIAIDQQKISVRCQMAKR